MSPWIYWLTVVLVSVAGGFGREVRDAMTARAEYLAEEGLARRQRQRIILQRDPLDTLQQRELGSAEAKLSADTGCRTCKRRPANTLTEPTANV